MVNKEASQNRRRTPVPGDLPSDFGDEGDITADADLPGPGSSEGSAGNMAEEDG